MQMIMQVCAMILLKTNQNQTGRLLKVVEKSRINHERDITSKIKKSLQGRLRGLQDTCKMPPDRLRHAFTPSPSHHQLDFKPPSRHAKDSSRKPQERQTHLQPAKKPPRRPNTSPNRFTIGISHDTMSFSRSSQARATSVVNEQTAHLCTSFQKGAPPKW